MKFDDLNSLKKLQDFESADVKVGGVTEHLERYSDSNGTIYEVDPKRGLFRVLYETDWQNFETEIS